MYRPTLVKVWNTEEIQQYAECHEGILSLLKSKELHIVENP